MSFHIVGIGASAGGLEAIEELFDNMPDDSGLAFVVVQHLSPDYKSLMVELLSKRTKMEVLRAEEGITVEPNKVYLIPPKKNLTIFHGKLLLIDQAASKGLNFPIDIFLESLAEDQGNKAIGIILSGTGSDGMRGIKTIKENSGIVMVQSEDTAKFNGMPKNAISTGLVDFILSPGEMPAKLISLMEHPYVSGQNSSNLLLTDQNNIEMLFALLRKKHKVDFTHYKITTVLRRIERRMTVNHIEEFKDYVRYLEQNSQEVTNLYKELLIGVTRFFRDTEAFEDLAQNWLPHIVADDKIKELRFWTAGCSTGEEAYSLAILAREALEKMEKQVNVKVFATDVDNEAIIYASGGMYPESIIADVNPERLSKYFIQKENGFQVIRDIREMVVFAQHDILKDPPFTNIDLISCRNLLIYLQPVLQTKVLELFNYALKPSGILLLGSSETTGDLSDYFEPLNHKWKIYRSRGRAKVLDLKQLGNMSIDKKRIISGLQNIDRSYRYAFSEEKFLERMLEAMDEHIPLMLAVNENMEVVYILGDTSGFFKVPSGKSVFNITKMASKDLVMPISTGLQKVFTRHDETNYTNVKVRVHDEWKRLDLKIKEIPFTHNQGRLAVVLLKETVINPCIPVDEKILEYDPEKVAEQRIYDLEQELQFTKENLQATIEELETSNEELQATNEELLASNEELQSTNEELQSVNEELHTVNDQYQSKIIELIELNNDMENLLSSTQIGTLFLDENLEIRKFTHPIEEIIHIVEKDIGRPLKGISGKIENIDLLKIARSVQDTDKPYESEVQTDDGKWYLMKVIPYEISHGTYSGIFVTIIDVTQLKKTEKLLMKSEKWLLSAASLTKVGGWEIDVKNMRTFWTEEVYKIHEVEPGFDHDVKKGIGFYHPEDRALISEAVNRIIQKGEDFDLKLRIITAKGNLKWVRVIGTAERNEGIVKRVYGAFQDVTEQTVTETRLNEARNKYKELYEAMNNPVLVYDSHENDKFIIREVNSAGIHFFSDLGDHLIGKELFDILPEGNDMKDAFLKVRESGWPMHLSLQDQSYGIPRKIEDICIYKLATGEIVSIINNSSGNSGNNTDNYEKETTDLN